MPLSLLNTQLLGQVNPRTLMGRRVLPRPPHRGEIHASQLDRAPFSDFGLQQGSRTRAAQRGFWTEWSARESKVIHLALNQDYSHTPRSSQDEVPRIADNSQTPFYGEYQKVAREYDEDFLKKHGGDLDTTLIFVSTAWRVNEHVLINLPGWTVLCCHFCVHHPDRFSAAT